MNKFNLCNLNKCFPFKIALVHGNVCRWLNRTASLSVATSLLLVMNKHIKMLKILAQKWQQWKWYIFVLHYELTSKYLYIDWSFDLTFISNLGHYFYNSEKQCISNPMIQDILGETCALFLEVLLYQLWTELWE